MTLQTARESLLADARAAADMVRAAGEEQAKDAVAQARRDADALVAAARDQGAEEGRVQAADEEAGARVRARGQVLAARRDAYDELRLRVREAVLRLRDDPEYDDLVERLSVQACRDLGPSATVERDPPGVGGVRAVAGSRLVDYTLPTLAERCVGHLGPAVRRLWS